jgi:hypothetical protein
VGAGRTRLKGLTADAGTPAFSTGDLSPWARQGVLLSHSCSPGPPATVPLREFPPFFFLTFLINVTSLVNATVAATGG